MIVPLDQRPDVVAIVPTLGLDERRLRACVASLGSSTGSRAVGVAVVWNSPHLAPAAMDDVLVLVPGLNLGFAGSLNHGRSRVDADYLWVIQDDLTVRTGCLEALLVRLGCDDRLAVVAPITVDEAGCIPHSRGAILLEDRMWSSYPPIGAAVADFDPTVELDCVVSSGSLTRIDAWDEVGGYDARFFPLYWSDLDFCHRLRQLGWQMALVPEAVIDHVLHGSSNTLLYDHFVAVNQKRLHDKHFPQPGAIPAPPVDVDPALLADVAVAASTQLVEFSRFANARLERERIGWKLRHPTSWLRPLAGRVLRALRLR